MTIPGNLLTTAMAVMPHTDVEQAIKVALTMDIPFWPQLPRLNYYEDMYVQAAADGFIRAFYWINIRKYLKHFYIRRLSLPIQKCI